MDKKFATCGPYTVIKTLGGGSYGKVKLGQGPGEERVAIKIFCNSTIQAKNMQSFTQEIHMFNILKDSTDTHPNLISMIDFSESVTYTKRSGTQLQRICLVLELAQNGDLFEYVCGPGKNLPEDICRYYFKQMIDGLGFMHSRGVAHRDLKPENLLFDKDFNLKITDFGFSTLMNKYLDGKLRTQLGTVGYQAPEILSKPTEYDGKSIDLFAAAVLLFIMFTGGLPFMKAKDSDPYYKLIAFNRIHEFWTIHTKIYPQLKDNDMIRDLIGTLLSVEPSDRYTIEEILCHPWMKEPVRSHEEIKKFLLPRKEALDKLQQEQEALKLKEQMELEIQNQQSQDKKANQRNPPFGKFRSIYNEDSDFQDVEKNYNLNSHTRQIKQYQEIQQKPTDFFTTLDKEYLLRLLLASRDRYCDKILKINPDGYKFTVRKTLNEELIEFTIQFFEKDDLINVDFVRRRGDKLKFLEQQSKVMEVIRDCKSDTSQAQKL